MFSKAFRLFVSSTFQDFGEERCLLQEQVFPALDEHCSAQGFGFRAVDMRWGVNGDAQLNQRTAEICLGEVIEAKGYPAPNLLILVGDRYGWVPLPFAIACDEFEAIRAWLAAEGENEAVSDLDRVYALDENHLVPGGMSAAIADLIGAYTLRSREDDLSELKAPEAWAPVEALLREALQAAARNLHARGQLRGAELGKYTLSLTEQEIRKGLEQLADGDGAAAANSIVWVRTTETAEPPVQALAEMVKHALPEGHVLHARELAESAGYGQQFVEQITAKLIVAIDGQIADFKARAQAPDFALQAERATHAAFAAERLSVFVGRESNLAAIAEHIASEARHPFVLTGIAGSGKTALMARAAAETKGTVVQRFVGASASSANQRSLLISVIEDLAALSVAALPTQWEDDDNRFVNQVRDLLAALDQPVAIFIDALDQLRAPYRPMWLPSQLHSQVKVIVSVLDDEAFVQERNIVLGLRRSLPEDAFLAIEPLSESDGAEILVGLQRDAQRGLTPEQQSFILERFHAAGASPLYLRIAFSIARRWRSHDDPRALELAGDVIALIGQFLDELSSVHHHEPLLLRRALGLIAAGSEGLSESEAIAVLSGYPEVMAAVSSERFGAHTTRLPDSVWTRMRRSLSPLLVEKGVEGEPLLQFFHRQVTELVRTRFYEPDRTALHHALAVFFDSSLRAGDGETLCSRRSLSELPFQLFHGHDRGRLDAILTDPVWIDAKIRLFAGATEIASDYEKFANPSDQLQLSIGGALRLASGIISRDPSQAMVQLYGRLIGSADADFLSFVLKQIPDCALCETTPALTPPGAEIARLEGHNGEVAALAVLPDGRLASGSSDSTIRIWDVVNYAEAARLIGHSNGVASLAVLRDGRLASGSRDSTIRIWDPASINEIARLEGHSAVVTELAGMHDGQLASGSWDETIRIWDIGLAAECARIKPKCGWISNLAALPSGCLAINDGSTVRILDPATDSEVARLDGHQEIISALVVLSGGRLASGSADHTVRVWDLSTFAEIARLEGHAGRVNALCELPGGRLASGSADHTIFVWDIESGSPPCQFEGHFFDVTSLAVLPDGRLASGSYDRTIRIWDVAAVATAAAFDGHKRGILALVAVSNDRLASASWDGSIRVWDTRTGEEITVLRGHLGPVAALAVLPDGRLASGSWDETIRIWDLATGMEVAQLRGHQFRINSLTVLPDGRIASASEDATIRLWDTTTAAEVARIEGHSFPVTSLAVLRNGRLASGSSDYTMRIWDTATLTDTARFEGSGPGVYALEVLPDGRLVSGSADSTIRFWDPATGMEIGRLENSNRGVFALAVLPGGRLASGSSDSTIRIWDTTTGTECARLEVDCDVEALVGLSDGRLIAGDARGRLHWLKIKSDCSSSSTQLKGQSEVGGNA